MFDTGEPRTGPEIRDALLLQAGEARLFLAAVPAGEFFAPQATYWSPAEHARHLVKSIRPVADAMGLPKLALRGMFGKAEAPSRDFVGMRETYRGALTGGATAGKFTPSAETQPADPAKRQEEILASLAAQMERLAARAGRWGEAALDRYRLPHPVLGPLTVREMLFFTVYHNAHHLLRVAERRAE
jgi:hypothetical protein